MFTERMKKLAMILGITVLLITMGSFGSFADTWEDDGDWYGEEDPWTDLETDPDTGGTTDPNGGQTTESATLAAVYNIVDGKLVFSTTATDYGKQAVPAEPSAEVKAKHQKAWDFTNNMMPAELMNYVVKYAAGTDGKGNTLASVSQVDEKDLSKWVLNLDMADAYNTDGSFNQPEFNETIIHEFGHLITLNNTQMEAVKNPNAATYTTAEGTLKAESYLNKFYSKFWKGNYANYKKPAKEGIIDYDAVTLKRDYPDNFVTEYAATNPEEDMAESFRFFVINGKPTGTLESNQKVLFYYDFAELVQYRAYIRGKLGL